MSKPKNMTPEQEAAWKEKYRAYMRDYSKRPKVKLSREVYRGTPQAKARKREHMRKYHAKPEVIARTKARLTKEFIKAKNKEYHARPEVKARSQTLEAKTKFRKYRDSLEYKIKTKEYHARPETKEKRLKRLASPEVIAKERERQASAKFKARAKERRASIAGKAQSLADYGKRRAAKRAAPIGDTREIKAWAKHWKALPVVFCHWCLGAFKPNKCHADHVMPLAKGGAHCRSNMVISCATCNLRKNAKRPSEWVIELEGWEAGLEGV